VTVALDNRKGALGISGCGRFSAGFSFESDVQFDGKKPEEMDSGPTRIVYSKVQPNDGDLWRPTVIYGGDVEIFNFDADTMPRGANL
jgi:hypothetical protein